MLTREPLALLATGLRVKGSTDTTIPTAAIDDNGTIFVNESWADTLTDRQYLLVLFHLCLIWYHSPAARVQREESSRAMQSLMRDFHIGGRS
jgi:hypothetical protein